jgi:hypothetical protein
MPAAALQWHRWHLCGFNCGGALIDKRQAQLPFSTEQRVAEQHSGLLNRM